MEKKEIGRFSRFFMGLNPLTLLFVLVVLVGIMTYIIPAGEFDRVMDEETGKMLVVAGTYKHIDQNPASLSTILLSFDAGLQKAAPVISFLFLIGGAIGVVTSTGTIEAVLNQIVLKFKSERGKNVIIAGIMFFFMTCSTTFGMGQEMMAFAPFVIVLMVSLGFDTVTAIGSMILGYAIGYGSSILNPFTLAVAQDIAGLPYPSGMGVRIALTLVMYAAALIYMIRYAKKVHDRPELSLSPVVPEEFRTGTKSIEKMTKKHIATAVIFLAGIAVLIWGAVTQGFYLSECSTVFLVVGLASGLVNKYSLNRIFKEFSKGAKDMAVPCLIIGFAMAITYILDSAQILDSIVYYLTLPLENLSPVISAGGMVIVQTIINFFINSGVTMATVTMPIMSPMAQILGVNQQVAVLAFQIGNGLSNALWVTCGTLMIGLGIANINYMQWLKFITKIFLILTVIGMAVTMLAQYLNWGPF